MTESQKSRLCQQTRSQAWVLRRNGRRTDRIAIPRARNKRCATYSSALKTFSIAANSSACNLALPTSHMLSIPADVPVRDAISWKLISKSSTNCLSLSTTASSTGLPSFLGARNKVHESDFTGKRRPDADFFSETFPRANRVLKPPFCICSSAVFERC